MFRSVRKIVSGRARALESTETDGLEIAKR